VVFWVHLPIGQVGVGILVRIRVKMLVRYVGLVAVNCRFICPLTKILARLIKKYHP